MKKILLLIAFCLPLIVSAQTYTLNYDSVRYGKSVPTSKHAFYGRFFLKNFTPGNLRVGLNGELLKNDTAYLTPTQAILNQYTSAQSANGWINGNFRADGGIIASGSSFFNGVTTHYAPVYMKQGPLFFYNGAGTNNGYLVGGTGSDNQFDLIVSDGFKALDVQTNLNVTGNSIVQGNAVVQGNLTANVDTRLQSSIYWAGLQFAPTPSGAWNSSYNNIVVAQNGSPYRFGYIKMDSLIRHYVASFIFNVKDFGATGNGVTNDRNSIQFTIDSASRAGGGTVYFPTGNYLVRRADSLSNYILHVPSNISLIGEGIKATKIINDPTTPNSEVRLFGIRIGLNDQSASNITMDGFTLNMNATPITTGDTTSVLIFGVGADWNNVIDSASTEQYHADNITLRNLDVIDTKIGIRNNKTSASYTYGNNDVFSKNWIVENCHVYGTYNRAMEFARVQGLMMRNNKIEGAGMVNILARTNDFHIEDNTIIYGHDTLSNCYQGSIRAYGNETGAIYLNQGIFNGTLTGNYFAADSLAADTVVGQAVLIKSERYGNVYTSYNIKSSGNTYSNKKTLGKEAFRTFVSGTTKHTIDGFYSDGDTWEGVMDFNPRVISGSSAKNATFKNFRFSNTTFDNLFLAAVDTVLQATNFKFSNVKFTATGTQIIRPKTWTFTDCSFAGAVTISSISPNNIFDNVKIAGALSNNTASTLFKNMPLIPIAATNAATTVMMANTIVTLPVITANRILTLPNNTVYAGQTIIVNNTNTAAFTWTFATSTVFLPDGASITTLARGTTYILTMQAAGTWIANSSYVAYGLGTGLENTASEATDALTFTTTEFKRVVSTATNLPIVANGYLIRQYRSASSANIIFISDDNRYFWNTRTASTWTGWKESAPIASPSLTGTPTAPTAAAPTNTTQIATTAYVKSQGYGTGTVTAVSSANTDIGVATGTTTPVLTFNKSVTGLTNYLDLTTTQSAAGNKTFSGQTNTKEIRATGTGVTTDGMGIIHATQQSGANYAAIGITRTGNYAMAMGLTTNNLFSFGTGPTRGINATIDTSIVEFDLHVGGMKLKNYLGNVLASVSSGGAFTANGITSNFGYGVGANSAVTFKAGTGFTNFQLANQSSSLINVVRIPDADGTLALTTDLARGIRLTGSGNGASTTISIAHGLTGITSASIATIQPINAASAGVAYITTDATNVNIVYTVAPILGTNNLSYNLIIKP